jgi:hypothetical protein
MGHARRRYPERQDCWQVYYGDIRVGTIAIRFLPKRTEADFQAWRDRRDWAERKYAMWERGERMPSQMANSLMTCPCGETFDSHQPESSYVHRIHIYAAQAADGMPPSALTRHYRLQ